MFVNELFGNNIQVRILRLFYYYPNTTYKEVEISKKLGAGYGSLRGALNSLESVGIIRRTKKEYTVNKDSHLFRSINELFAEERKNSIPYFATDTIAEVVRRLSKFKDILSLVVFGSIAKGTATIHSDIDILLTLKDEGNKEVIEKEICNIGEKNKTTISPKFLEEKELENVKRSALWKDIETNHITVYGGDVFGRG